MDLTTLRLDTNAISNLTPLAKLIHLEYLDLGFGDPMEENSNVDMMADDANAITSLSPLSTLVNLEYLNVAGNAGITDISVISSLPNLEELWLGHSALAGKFSPLASRADRVTT